MRTGANRHRSTCTRTNTRPNGIFYRVPAIYTRNLPRRYGKYVLGTVTYRVTRTFNTRARAINDGNNNTGTKCSTSRRRLHQKGGYALYNRQYTCLPRILRTNFNGIPKTKLTSTRQSIPRRRSNGNRRATSDNDGNNTRYYTQCPPTGTPSNRYTTGRRRLANKVSGTRIGSRVRRTNRRTSGTQYRNVTKKARRKEMNSRSRRGKRKDQPSNGMNQDVHLRKEINARPSKRGTTSTGTRNHDYGTRRGIRSRELTRCATYVILPIYARVLYRLGNGKRV